MRTLILTLTLLLTGCDTMYKVVPSFWDDNQSNYMAQTRLAVSRLDCEEPLGVQAARIKDQVDLFVFYSESKGRSQQDVLHLVKPLQQTVDDFAQRTAQGGGSKTYCQLKKKIMTEQAQRASASVMGRW